MSLISGPGMCRIRSINATVIANRTHGWIVRAAFALCRIAAERCSRKPPRWPWHPQGAGVRSPLRLCNPDHSTASHLDPRSRLILRLRSALRDQSTLCCSRWVMVRPAAVPGLAVWAPGAANLEAYLCLQQVRLRPNHCNHWHLWLCPLVWTDLLSSLARAAEPSTGRCVVRTSGTGGKDCTTEIAEKIETARRCPGQPESHQRVDSVVTLWSLF